MYGYGYAQRYDVIRVNGENGARSIQLAPGSEVLMLDSTAPIVWLAQADGAGYKTVTPFNITPFEKKPEPNYEELLERIERLEDKINGKSDTTNARKQTKQQAESDS